jgi:hypothetical protein
MKAIANVRAIDMPIVIPPRPKINDKDVWIIHGVVLTERMEG